MARLAEKELSCPADHWTRKIQAFRPLLDRDLDGFIDTSAGFVYSDKACAWCRHLCEKAGVKFVLGETGRLEHLVVDLRGETKHVLGLVTTDGLEHRTDLVIVAAGGWTPSLVPEVEGRLQTAAGSVITVSLPKNRPDLWEKVTAASLKTERPCYRADRASTPRKTFQCGHTG